MSSECGYLYEKWFEQLDMDIRALIIGFSFGSLIIANLVAIWWYIDERGFEPFITSLLIFAAITGIFVEKWIAERDKRKELLVGLAHELFINMNKLKDGIFTPTPSEMGKFVFYPRLESIVVNSVIWSGSFSGKKDKDFFKQIHIWREKCQQFNRLLDQTETACMLNSSTWNITKWRETVSSGVVRKKILEAYNGITNEILGKYSKESGIDKNTDLFK